VEVVFVPAEEQVELPADGLVPFPVLLLAQLAQVAYSADLAVVKFMPNSPNRRHGIQRWQKKQMTD
jgi:hypothetical protein